MSIYFDSSGAPIDFAKNAQPGSEEYPITAMTTEELCDGLRCGILDLGQIVFLFRSLFCPTIPTTADQGSCATSQLGLSAAGQMVQTELQTNVPANGLQQPAIVVCDEETGVGYSLDPAAFYENFKAPLVTDEQKQSIQATPSAYMFTICPATGGPAFTATLDCITGETVSNNAVVTRCATKDEVSEDGVNLTNKTVYACLRIVQTVSGSGAGSSAGGSSATLYFEVPPGGQVKPDANQGTPYDLAGGVTPYSGPIFAIPSDEVTIVDGEVVVADVCQVNIDSHTNTSVGDDDNQTITTTSVTATFGCP